MHVIQVTGGLGERYGGPSRTVTALATGLSSIGVEVDLVTGINTRIDGNTVLPLSSAVHLHFVNAWQVGRLRYYPQYTQRMRDLLSTRTTPAATLVHDHGLWGHFNFCAWRACREKGIPYLLSPRGMIDPWAIATKRWKKAVAWKIFQQRILDTASLLIATSEFEYAGIRGAGLKNPVAIIPNGISLDYTQNNSMQLRSDSRNARRTVLFLSRIHPKKGVLNLLDAWATVVDRGWRLVIAGPDDDGHLGVVLERIQKLGLTESVLYAGAVEGEAKNALYRKADLFVLPTYSENFGLVVAEALAQGVPVITTKGAPWRDLETYHCGWWVDVGVEPLITALRDAMARSDGERQAMGEAGRSYVRRYDWEQIAFQMRETYAWVLGQRGKPEWVYLS